MRSVRVHSVFIFCFVYLTACGGSDDDEGDKLSCPAVIQHLDPLVKITAVTDSTSNEELLQVKISELVVNDRNVRFDELNSELLSRVDLVDEGVAAICTMPCAFGMEPGEYSMTVSAPAYEPERFEFAPTYSSDRTPVCNHVFSGSYEISFSLSPE